MPMKTIFYILCILALLGLLDFASSVHGSALVSEQYGMDVERWGYFTIFLFEMGLLTGSTVIASFLTSIGGLFNTTWALLLISAIVVKVKYKEETKLSRTEKYILIILLTLSLILSFFVVGYINQNSESEGVTQIDCEQTARKLTLIGKDTGYIASPAEMREYASEASSIEDLSPQEEYDFWFAKCNEDLD